MHWVKQINGGLHIHVVVHSNFAIHIPNDLIIGDKKWAMHVHIHFWTFQYSLYCPNGYAMGLSSTSSSSLVKGKHIYTFYNHKISLRDIEHVVHKHELVSDLVHPTHLTSCTLSNRECGELLSNLNCSSSSNWNAVAPITHYTMMGISQWDCSTLMGVIRCELTFMDCRM